MPAAQRPATGPLPPPSPSASAGEAPAPHSDVVSATYDDAQRAEQMYREGVRRYESRDLMGAIQVWRDAVRLAPEHPEYNRRLGLALTRNPRWHKEAEQHLLTALKKDALNTEATIALGHIYAEAGLKKRAEAQYRKVLAYSPSNKEAIKGLEALGIEYSFLGKQPKSESAKASTAKPARAKAAGAASGGFLSKLKRGKGGEQRRASTRSSR
jgi:tetratricopeptide (TPR) repeat protein